MLTHVTTERVVKLGRHVAGQFSVQFSSCDVNKSSVCGEIGRSWVRRRRKMERNELRDVRAERCGSFDNIYATASEKSRRRDSPSSNC